MNIRLEQTAKEKTRAEYAEETLLERQAMAALTTQIVCAELHKYPQRLEAMDAKQKASIIAHATQVAFTIARAVTAEDVRRHGSRIDHE